MGFADHPADDEHFSAFVLKEYDGLLCYANSILRDEGLAQDAVSMSLHAILKEYDKFRNYTHARLKKYMVTVVRNNCYDIYQKNGGGKVVFLEDAGDLADECSDPVLETVIHKEIRTQLLRACIEQLNYDFHTAIVMWYYENTTIDDIADVLGIKPSSARSVLYRARKKLGELYAKAYTEEDANGKK